MTNFADRASSMPLGYYPDRTSAKVKKFAIADAKPTPPPQDSPLQPDREYQPEDPQASLE
jgi:hypothetical protein